jgi:hypothetical protein
VEIRVRRNCDHNHRFFGIQSLSVAEPVANTSRSIAPQPETTFRGIEDETWKSHGPAIQIDDYTGTPLERYTLRAARFAVRKAAHSFNHLMDDSDTTPGMVSFQ